MNMPASITNFVAMTMILVTNVVADFRPPSGEQKFLTTVISLQYTACTNNFCWTTNIPISTNVSRWVWCQVPLHDDRDPLSIPDPPPPKLK